MCGLTSREKGDETFQKDRDARVYSEPINLLSFMIPAQQSYSDCHYWSLRGGTAPSCCFLLITFFTCIRGQNLHLYGAIPR